MKNVFLLLVVFCLSLTTVSLANPVIHITKDKVFTLDLRDWTGNSYNVLISDASEAIVHSGKMNSSTLTKKSFDVSNLPTGIYKVKIFDSLKSITHEILIGAGSLSLIGSEDVKYAPVIRKNGSYLDVDYLALNKEATLKVYDAQGNSVYTEEIKDKDVYSRRLQIQSMKKGTYYVEFSTEHGVYNESFMLN